MDNIKELVKELKAESEKLTVERDELTLAMDKQSRELQRLSELQSERQQMISQYQTQQSKAIAKLNKTTMLLEAITERFGDLFPEEKKKPEAVEEKPLEDEAAEDLEEN